jgi:histidinol-phosphate aminotransferase
MSARTLTRRHFTRAVGAALGASWAAPALAPAADRRRPAAPAGGPARLDSNENPYGPSPLALEAMGRSRGQAARYPDAIEERVMDAIARLHGVGPENVVLGCGSGEILKMADMAFLAAGRCVVAAEPTFEAVLSYARVTRAEPVKVPLAPDFRHDLPRMAAACEGRAALVYVCNPNNPTGTIVTREELGAFFDRVPRGTVVLVDEAYHHFVEDTRYASATEWLAKAPDLIVARTFSKIYGLAGMRLGYGLGAGDRVEAMREHRIWNNTNAAVLEAALASLKDAAHVPAQRARLNDTRRWVCRELEADGRRYIPSETNFVMIHVGRDVAPVIAGLRERGIHPGRRFASMPDWLRVSIGTREEMGRFLAALREAVPVPAAPAAAGRGSSAQGGDRVSGTAAELSA